MAYAKNQMGVGVPAAQAAADFIAVVNAAVSAAGTTQGTATTVQADFNGVTTASSLQGVILYAGVVGDSAIIFNDNTGVNIVVYPPVGHKFDNLATNAGFNLASNQKVMCMKFSSTRWIALLSA